MMKRSHAVLVAIALLVPACGSNDTSERAAADSDRVPDVVHMELRAGVEMLESKGYRVVLSDELGSKEYVGSLNEYLETETMGMSPQPHIGATDPAPGEAGGEGSTVTVTKIECPGEAESCD